MLHVLTSMRLLALALAAVLFGGSAAAQTPQPSSAAGAAADGGGQLPVSLDRIKGALEEPIVQPLRGMNEIPTYRVQVQERQRVNLEDLLNGLDFKSGPTPAGGLYAYDQQRRLFPSVDNPLRQPYSEFSQPELTTILVENLAGRYLAGRAASAITTAQRAEAE